MDKNKRKKFIALGIGVCSLALAGVVYSIDNIFVVPEKKAVSSQSEPLDPIQKKKTSPIIPKLDTENEEVHILKKPKPATTTDNSLSYFRTEPVNNYTEERAQALNTLNNQIKEEKQQQVVMQQLVQVNSKEPEQPIVAPTPAPSTPVIPPVVPPVTGGEEEENPLPEIPVIVDYSALITLIAQAETIDQSLYIRSSTELLTIELLIAQRIVEDQNSSQSAVNAQTERLQIALNQLILKGDKTVLHALYTQAEELLTDIYTAETVQVFEEAIKESKRVLDLSDVTQEVIDQTLTQLQESINQLLEKEEPYLSLAYLQRVVSVAQAIDQSDFTSESVESLQSTLADVLDYISSGEYKNEEIQQHKEALEQAIVQLVRKADKVSLIALLEQAQAIDLTIYTQESSNRLESIILDVIVAVENDNLSQKENDQLLLQLQEAIDQLVEDDSTLDLEETD